jgi:beta-lactamase superfamily II metal-dependent hydrolase
VYELDVLAVGKEKDADAAVLRFTRPDNGQMAHVVVDAGWQADGDKVVQMLNRYEAPHVDVAIVTHPDGDHIGGMGKLFDNFSVEHLVIHRLDQRGGASLRAARAVRELVAKAEAVGTYVTEPTPGLSAFDRALTILGPSDDYYDRLVAEQLEEEGSKALGVAAGLRETLRAIADRVLESMPVDEVPFDDGPGANPRNNSSVITLLQLDGKRALLTADAGVEAIHAALDYAQEQGLDALRPDFVQIPHHGSRRNASSELLDRLLGSIGQAQAGAAFVNVVSKTDPKHPAGRVVNAYSRRGYPWWWTAGNSLCWSSPDAPPRSDYGPVDPGPVLEELDDDA